MITANFDMTITSYPPEHEPMVAELWLGQWMWAEVAYHAHDRNFTVQFYSPSRDHGSPLDLDEVTAALSIAMNRLTEICVGG